MGIRGELFSTKVSLQNRTYFFNVKENRMGDLYLNIVESKNRETEGFERQSVILFADDLPQFLAGFDESLRVLEKARREKKRSGPPSPRSERNSGHPGGGKSPDHPGRGKPMLVKKGTAVSRRDEPAPRKPASIKVRRREEP
ncbi:MAG: DUF3276 family protein [Treponema sp.]|jgi:hypothetical protein|nr:DUF3276 family protein [Treponema sp.]